MSRILLTISLMILASASIADVVVLKNGDRISGTVTSLGADKVGIKPDYAGGIEISMEAIASLRTDSETEFALSDGSTNRYRVEQVSDNQLKLANSEKTIDVALSDVERFGPEPPSKNWSANLDFSSDFSRGNTDSQNTNLQWKSTYTRDVHRYKTDLLISRAEENDVETKEKDRLTGSYNWLFADQWFFALDATYERDPIARLDRRFSLNPGLGYDFWNTADRKLSVQLGAGYASERNDGQDESSANVDWRLD